MIEIGPGEVWMAGAHTFLCGDLEDGAFDRLLSLLPTAPSMVYSDPPWNAGNCRYWRTHAGVGRSVDFEAFSAILAHGIQASGVREAWLEMGLSETPRWLEIVRPDLPPPAGQWQVYYGPPVTAGPYKGCVGRPNYLHRFSDWCDVDSDPTGLKGERVTEWAFRNSAVSGGIVVDPCVGRGMTVRMAHRFGMICFGNELNPKRLAVLLEWLRRAGYEPERVR